MHTEDILADQKCTLKIFWQKFKCHYQNLVSLNLGDSCAISVSLGNCFGYEFFLESIEDHQLLSSGS